jgi:probable phosphoglycerate mutase
MLFFYIRHGDPVYNPDSLTPLGKRQAEALAKRLSRYGIDEIYSSTSQRAKDTAKPTCELLKKDPVELDWCNEKYAWEEFTVINDDGKKGWVFYSPEYKRLFCKRKIRNLRNDWYEAPDFENEKFKDGVIRVNREVDAFFEQLGYCHDRNKELYIPKNSNEKRIALFAHQGFGMTFLSSVLDIPYPEFTLHFDLSHSSMTVIEFKAVDGVVIPKILTLSNDSHIYSENLPTKYNNETMF